MIAHVRRGGIDAFEVKNKHGYAIQGINKEESGDVEFPVGNNICLKKT